MTLGALLDMLLCMTDENRDKKIYLEGCDCEGPWNGEIVITTVHRGFDSSEGVVLLKREDT